MSNVCHELHQFVHMLPRLSFPFEKKLIPQNGIYLLFEKNEEGHSNDRIVRIGTHTGEGQLTSRLNQHFVKENKDRSIFRKNIGRCLLHRDNHPYLPFWELDNTTRKGKKENLHLIDLEFQSQIESQITEYMQNHYSFCMIKVDTKTDRLELEAKLISTVSLCKDCNSSETWLGRSSPKDKIKDSGLWQVNELYKTPLSEGDLDRLRRFAMS